MANHTGDKYQEFISTLAKEKSDGGLKPVYLLQGEETFFITALANWFETNVLNESEKAFNQHVLYGRDIDVKQLLGVAKRYPMMAEKQLVIVKEAQNLKSLADLVPYLENPLSTTVLVFCFMGKKVNATTREGKAFKKYTIFNSDPIAEWHMTAWILDFCRNKGLDISQHNAQLLFEYLGNNLSRIDSEIHKLQINIAPRTNISSEDIETYVGISREYNVFELQRAIGSGNKKKTAGIIHYMINDTGNNPFVMTLANLFSFFQKLLNMHTAGRLSDQQMASLLGVSPFFLKEYEVARKNYPHFKVKAIIDTLHELDRKFKGYGVTKTEEKELYKELFVKIMR